MAQRPENIAPPEIFYNAEEARKYTSNSHMIETQDKLTRRAVELLALPDDGPKLLLDLGCGSGLSGDILTDLGHTWVGLDISRDMLDVAVERETEGDLLLGDLGQGLPLRPHCFDGAVSISAVQWLCNADKTGADPRARLKAFFTTLYRCLSRGARAVLQLYPNGPEQAEMITAAALRVGFGGGLVVDFPNSTRAKKHYLVLTAGPSLAQMPKAKDGEDDEEEGQVAVEDRKRARDKKSKNKRKVKDKAWVLKKKEQMRNKARRRNAFRADPRRLRSYRSRFDDDSSPCRPRTVRRGWRWQTIANIPPVSAGELSDLFCRSSKELLEDYSRRRLNKDKKDGSPYSSLRSKTKATLGVSGPPSGRRCTAAATRTPNGRA